MMSSPARDALIDHMDGRHVPVVVIPKAAMDAVKAASRAKTISALLKRGWLRTDGRITPRFTLITEAGRAELARLLAEYAEVLIRVGYVEPEAEAGQRLGLGRFLGSIPAVPKAAEFHSVSE